MPDGDQLLLGLNLKAEEDFSSFYTVRDLKLVLSTLKQCVEQDQDDFIYLSGQPGSGKSHLLQAICHYAYERGKTASYIPLSQLIDEAPGDVLEDHSNFQFLCIDELDNLQNHTRWQEALFHLYNERLSDQLPIFFSASAPAGLLDLQLGDLKSRLTACLSFQLAKLKDEEKAELFQYRAKLLGMEITDQHALYLIQHYSRDTHDLMAALKQLDMQSLKKGRKITQPFIKSVLKF